MIALWHWQESLSWSHALLLLACIFLVGCLVVAHINDRNWRK
jgi:hypothetical protein